MSIAVIDKVKAPSQGTIHALTKLDRATLNKFALRIRHAAATAEQPLIEVAPIWPVQLLV